MSTNSEAWETLDKAYYELKAIAHTSVCAVCGAPLVLYFDQSTGKHALRCGKDRSHEAYKPALGPIQAYKEGLPLNPVLEEAVKRGIKLRSAVIQDAETQLFVVRALRTDFGTGEVLAAERRDALIAYAQRYGLDPWRGHVCILYGEPYVTEEAYAFTANRSGVKYSEAGHPMTPEERTLHGVAEGGYAWLWSVRRGDNDAEYTGIGIVQPDEITAMSTKDPRQLRSPVVAHHPSIMARKRARRDALKQAFPLEAKDE